MKWIAVGCSLLLGVGRPFLLLSADHWATTFLLTRRKRPKPGEFWRVERARALSLALLLSLAALLALAQASKALEIPVLSGRVVDQAQILEGATAQRLEETLRALEKDTGAQVAVLTLATLEGEVLEDFSLRVAESWGLGSAQRDNGVLVLVVRDDRKVRLEVGYGLEAILPDLAVHRILDDGMLPRFREGDFSGGIEAAVVSVAGVVRGDPDALPPETARAPSGDPTDPFVFLVVLAPLMWSALVVRGCGGWLLYFFLMPFFWGVPTAAFGQRIGFWVLAAWVVAGLLGRLFVPKVATSPEWGLGGWSTESSGGGFSGGGSSGSGSSSGGFSGGGGSFGGGGASGSW